MSYIYYVPSKIPWMTSDHYRHLEGTKPDEVCWTAPWEAESLRDLELEDGDVVVVVPPKATVMVA